jgi:Ca-activated chloride channel homolog
MKRTKPTSPAASSTAFGLIAWLERTRVALPLKGVDCRFEVTAGVAHVEIDQIYFQDNAQPLDCTYTFPLPAGAAVHRCEMHVNGRVIRAKVEERGEAQRIYRRQKAAGRRAALVESERDNLFTLSLGNLQPGDVVILRLAYFQELERAADAVSLRVPVCPGVRYIPGKALLRAPRGRGIATDTDQVPDASRISPPRMDALHPDAAYFSASGRIARSDVAEGTLSSPTHPVLARDEEQEVEVLLADGGTVPDRDFVLRWSEPAEVAIQPRGWSFREGPDTYALVQLRAPREVAVAEDFPQDFYFLIDRSGSMEGAKWEKTCEALRGFVALLGEHDRVWITLFESEFQDFAERPLPAREVADDRRFRQLVRIGTGGGTELLPAARHVLKKVTAHSKGRRAVAILITDGQVGNERAVTDLFARCPALTVHVFGIDTAVNDALLQSLARQQGGECWLQTPDDDIAGLVAKLGHRLRRPVLTGLRLRGNWETPVSRMPDIHAEESVRLPLHSVAAAEDAVALEASDAAGAAHRFRIGLMPTANEAIRLLFARQLIRRLESQGDEAGAIALAKTHNLLCRSAAFVAWDDAEQVVVAREEIHQPSMELAQFAGVLAMPRRLPGLPRFLLGNDELGDFIADNDISFLDAAPPPAPTSGTCPPLRSRSAKSQTRPIGDQRAAERMRSIYRRGGDLDTRLAQTGVPAELVRLLLAWADSDPAKAVERRAALEHLVKGFASREFSPGEWREHCAAFIVEQIATGDPIREQALEIVREWQPADKVE